jgi:hypothetical protein
MQPSAFHVTKSNLRKSIISGALEQPFFGNEYMIEYYAAQHKFNIEDERDRQNLENAIMATNHITPTSARTHMGNFCDDVLKANDKTPADLPLTPGVPMVEQSWKTLGQGATFTGPEYELSFSIIEELIKTHSMTVTKTNPFDGYIPLQLLVWFLLQVALDKKLVRTGVCVYALRLLMSTGHYRLPSRRWGSPEMLLLTP